MLVPPDRVVVPEIATTQSPRRSIFLRMRIRSPASTIPSAVRHLGTTTAETPQASDSRRQVDSSGVSAKIGACGRDLETSRAE